MHSLLAVVFETERNANKGKEALLQLEAEGEIVLHGYGVVAKHPDGTTKVDYEDAHQGRTSPEWSTEQHRPEEGAGNTL